MQSKGALTVLPVINDSTTFNLEMQPSSGGLTNYLYVSPFLTFNPAQNILLINTNAQFTSSLVANGTTGTIAQVLTANGTGGFYWANASGGFANGQSIQVQNLQSNGITLVTNVTASGNQTSGALQVNGGIATQGSLYVGNRVGFGNSTNYSVAYTFYNANTNSIDTVFGL